MPETSDDTILKHSLAYPEPPDGDAFVMDVMAGVSKARRIRRRVLLLFGLGGAAFGVAGAFLLSDRIAQLFTGLPAIGLMQTALYLVAAVSFYTWFMNDDLSLSG